MMRFVIIMMLIACATLSNAEDNEIDCRHPPHLHAEHCCDMPNTRAQFLKCAEKFHKSGPHHLMNPPPPPPPGARGFRQSSRFRRQAAEEEQCFVDCLLNTTNVVQEDSIMREKAISALEQTLNDNSWKTGIPIAVDMCIDHIKQIKEHIDSFPKHPDTKCSNYGKFFVGCINRQLMANCPVGIWKESEDCNMVKKFIQQCDGTEFLKGHHGKRHF